MENLDRFIYSNNSNSGPNLVMFDSSGIFIANHSDNGTSSLSVELYIPAQAALIGFIGAIMICLVGVIGNLITITALFKQSGRLNSRATTTFVIHLAIADLLFCSLVMPITSGRYLTRSWPFGPLLCNLYPLFYYGTVATSLMLITMITINRFVLIAFNAYYNRIYTSRNVILMILFCWLFSYGLVSIPFAELWGRLGYQANTFSCTILRDNKGRSPKKFLFILGFFLPMTTIVICYGLIYLHIKRQARIKDVRSRTPSRDLRLTLLICVVFGAFLICFLPLFIGNVFIPDHRYPYFHVSASVFAWLNSCINPFIYFAMNARYRQAFKRLFHVKNNQSYSVNNTNQQQSDNLQTNDSATQELPRIATNKIQQKKTSFSGSNSSNTK